MYPLYLTKEVLLFTMISIVYLFWLEYVEYSFWFHNTDISDFWEIIQFISFQELDALKETEGQHTEYSWWTITRCK
jgi:hypothetical protein